MRNQKGLVVPLVIAIVVIIIAGGIYYFSRNKNVTNIVSNVSQTDQTAVANCKSMIATDWNKGFQCILDLGKSISDYHACDSLSDTQQSKDPDVQKQDFVSLCKIYYATAKKDVSICSSLKSFSDQMTQAVQMSCISGYVVATKDIQACNAITDPTLQSRCVASGKSGTDMCKALIKVDEQNMCYQQLAAKGKDASLCDNITGPKASSDKEFCLADVARAKVDWQMCNTIKTVTTRDWCVSNVIILNKLDSKLCDNAGARKSQCYAYPR